MGKLRGKVAVITGGSTGIGLATAKLFVKEGALRLHHHRRRQKELDEAVKAIGSNVTGIQGDVAKLADLDRLYDTVARVKGRIDIVFANAGVAEFAPLASITEEHFDKLFGINVKGTLFTVQKALPLLNVMAARSFSRVQSRVSKALPPSASMARPRLPSAISCEPGPWS